MKKHADKWERQLDKAARAGDVAQIQHLLADEAAPTLDNLTKFDPSEAADFIQQSIQAAQNTAGLPSIPKHRKKISIAICIAAACLLATAGTYAAGRFSCRIFEEDGVVQYEIVRSDLTEKQKQLLEEALANPPSGGSITSTSYEEMASDAQEVEEATGITPLVPSYLPDDFSEPLYQIIRWTVRTDANVELTENDSPDPQAQTMFYGAQGRSIRIKQEILGEEVCSLISCRKSNVIDSGVFTSKSGHQYLYYQYRYPLSYSVTYISIEDDRCTTFDFNELTKQEIEDVLNSIE